MITMPKEVLSTQVEFLNARIRSLEPLVKRGNIRLNSIGRTLDRKANEIKMVPQTPTTNNKSKRLLRQRVAVLVEDFQNIVDLAYRIKVAVEKNEFILAKTQRRRDELMSRMVQPAATTITQHQNYRTRAAQEQIDAILKDASEGAKRRRDKSSQRERSLADRAARPKPWQGMHIGNGKPAKK
jgi:ElaB/YqjD/DUF883 family membrane-anchored ribosome-binding protein